MTKVRTIDDKGDNTLADGETLVVPLRLMTDSQGVHGKPAHQLPTTDGAMHRPGFAQLSDADTAAKIAAYDGYEKKLADAYKAPPPVDLNAAQTVAMAAAVTAAHTPRSVEQAHANYADRIANAWRQA